MQVSVTPIQSCINELQRWTLRWKRFMSCTSCISIVWHVSIKFFYSLIIWDNAHWMTKQRLHFTFRSELSCYSWQHFNVFYHKNSKQIMQIYKRKRKWKVNWSASSTEIWGTVILDISILRSLTDWVKKIRSNLRQLSTTNWDIFKLPYISPRL